MRLIDIIRRQQTPIPWAEGEKIPWNESGFSQRILQEHLSQAHDAASRRTEIIDQHVDWIHRHLLSGKPARILDLGCGPGLYSSRLARLGHVCTGIDFAPASIQYAREQAGQGHLPCTYIEDDIRSAEYGSGFDLIMLIFGEFNVFRLDDAQRILMKSAAALAGGGLILLEPHTFEAVHRLGHQPPSWYTSLDGLFSERPHICLKESFWDAELRVATERFFIIDVSTGEVTRHAASIQAYTPEQYRALLIGCGFSGVEFHPSLVGDRAEASADLFAISSRKPNTD